MHLIPIHIMMCFFLLYYRRNSFPGRLCQNNQYVKIDIYWSCNLRFSEIHLPVLCCLIVHPGPKHKPHENEKGPSSRMNLNVDGEGGIWTPAPCNRPTPLAGAPLRPLEYFSKARTANVKSCRSVCGILHAVSICLTTLCYYTREIFPCQLIYIIFHRCYNVKALQV